MQKRYRRWGLTPFAATLLLLPALQASAQNDDVFGEYWGAYATLNYFSWDNLTNVVPLGTGGPFPENTGLGAELGGYTSVARWGSVWLLAGMELGLTGFNYDAVFDTGLLELESAMALDYLSASMSFRFGDPGGRYLDLDLGLGSYLADTLYIDCAVIVRCFRADTDSSATGIYLGVSGMVGSGIILGARIHNVDFDAIEAVDLGVSPLDGPIYSVFIGWEFSNW